MDHFSSYRAAGNACLAVEEGMEAEAARSAELDRQAKEFAREVAAGAHPHLMSAAVGWAMEGSDVERDAMAAMLVHFDTLYELAALHGTAAETTAARAIQGALDPLRAKLKASVARVRRKQLERQS